jgi:hypothetical protein
MALLIVTQEGKKIIAAHLILNTQWANKKKVNSHNSFNKQ